MERSNEFYTSKCPLMRKANIPRASERFLFYSNEKEGNVEITRFANACAHFSQIRVNSWAKGMSSVATEAFL